MNNFSNARAFFEKIISDSNPYQLICNLVSTSPSTSETEWLEFKSGDGLDETFIKKTWSKCLSAFANTSGGVLIFGLKCSKNSITSLDEVYDLALCKDAFKIEMVLKELHHQATSPPVLGVEIKVYTEDKQPGKPGFVVVYIPESINRPHRAEYGEHKTDRRYWIRAGDSNVECSVSHLRLLFDPRSQPRLEPFVFYNSRNNGVQELNVCLTNKGYSSAYDVYCVVDLSVDIYNEIASEVKDTKLHSNMKPYKINILNALHPELPSLFLRLSFPINDSINKIKFEVKIYCKDAEPFKYIFEVPKTRIEGEKFSVKYNEKISLRYLI